MILDVPVDPDAPTARRWLEDELAKGEYRQAQPAPNPLGDFLEWLARQGWDGDAASTLGLTVLVVVIVAVLVIAFLVFGVPRLSRRRRDDGTGELFGESDDRDAQTLRRDAERAAADGDFATAIADMFRAIARRLADRDLVVILPGTTARAVGARAGSAFPAFRERLLEAAGDFDAVRYLGEPSSEERWTAVARLERELRSARPEGQVLDPELGVIPR